MSKFKYLLCSDEPYVLKILVKLIRLCHVYSFNIYNFLNVSLSFISLFFISLFSLV